MTCERMKGLTREMCRGTEAQSRVEYRGYEFTLTIYWTTEIPLDERVCEIERNGETRMYRFPLDADAEYTAMELRQQLDWFIDSGKAQTILDILGKLICQG